MTVVSVVCHGDDCQLFNDWCRASQVSFATDRCRNRTKTAARSLRWGCRQALVHDTDVNAAVMLPRLRIRPIAPGAKE